MLTKSMNVVDLIVKRLRALAQNSPDLQNATKLYEAILPILRDANIYAVPVSLTPEQARVKMENGLPLLHDQHLGLSVEAVRKLILQLARAVEAIHGVIDDGDPLLRTEAAHRIRLALEENRLNISALLPYIVAGDDRPVASTAQEIDLDTNLVLVLAHNALEPALHEWRRELTPLAEGIKWHKGFCFVCGAVASLGELQGNDQAMHLRCGQCGADWPFRRLLCLYCGNEDHNTQKYLYAEKEREKMHVEVCDKCKGYIKVIASFDPTPAEMLSIEDLATLHLDYIAQERGYVRRTVL